MVHPGSIPADSTRPSVDLAVVPKGTVNGVVSEVSVEKVIHAEPPRRNRSDADGQRLHAFSSLNSIIS